MSGRKKKSSAEALDFIIPEPCRHDPGGTEKHQLAAPRASALLSAGLFFAFTFALFIITATYFYFGDA